MILIIDNYDSFTYNLVQYIGEICIQHKEISKIAGEIKVFRNDKITVEQIKKLKPKYIVISPGPCTPNEAGVSVSVIKSFATKIPILGVCLGHQCIIHAYGGKIIRAPEIVHGKTSKIFHDGKTIFNNIENPFIATRYHSLIGEKKSLPAELEISAQTKEGLIMGVRLKTFNVQPSTFNSNLSSNRRSLSLVHCALEGVQFHPESILTVVGKKLLLNFLRLRKA